METYSGWRRDLTQELLVQRNDPAAVAPLEEIALHGKRAEARLQALCTLDGMRSLSEALVIKALADEHPGVRRHAVRLCEGRKALGEAFAKAAEKLVDDPDAHVRLQLAYTLGNGPGQLGGLLGRLAMKDPQDPFMSAAVLSSVSDINLGPMLRAVMELGGGKRQPPPQLLEKLLDIAQATNNADATATLLASVTRAEAGRYQPWQLAALATLLDSLDRRDRTLEDLAKGDGAAALGPAVKQTSGLLAAAREIAAKSDLPVEQRAAALRLLARDAASRGQDLKFLESLLSPQSPEALQSAAVYAIGRVRGAGSDRVPQILLAGWKGYGPELRARAMDALLSRPQGVKAVLDAIEQKKVLPAEIEAERRQRLLQQADAASRARANTLLADVVNPDRQKVLDAFTPAASLGGDPGRGHATFTKVCATCHKLNNEGNAVGPDLAALSDKSPEYLLMNVIDPNRAVEAKFTNYVIETKSGETLSGIVAAETGNSVTLVSADGKSHVVLRTDVQSLRSTGTSLMPEGLEKQIDHQAMADLLAFLMAAE
jgi:putative heme-binding domain-containing protein